MSSEFEQSRSWNRDTLTPERGLASTQWNSHAWHIHELFRSMYVHTLHTMGKESRQHVCTETHRKKEKVLKKTLFLSIFWSFSASVLRRVKLMLTHSSFYITQLWLTDLKNQGRSKTNPKYPAEDVRQTQHCSKQTVFSQSMRKIEFNKIHCAGGRLINVCFQQVLTRYDQWQRLGNISQKQGANKIKYSASASVVNQHNDVIWLRNAAGLNNSFTKSGVWCSRKYKKD